jgi:hypothetical protein
MGTREGSKTVTARRDWSCVACRGAIERGTRYFSYKVGLYHSDAYCLDCARARFAGTIYAGKVEAVQNGVD